MEIGSSETSFYMLQNTQRQNTRWSFPKAYKDRGTALGIYNLSIR
jgi:hypothetical protein